MGLTNLVSVGTHMRYERQCENQTEGEAAEDDHLTNERSGYCLTRSVYPIPGSDSSNVLCVCDDVNEDKQEPDEEAAAVNLAHTSTEAGGSQQERCAADQGARR
jgi:hypothetical protein